MTFLFSKDKNENQFTMNSKNLPKSFLTRKRFKNFLKTIVLIILFKNQYTLLRILQHS